MKLPAHILTFLSSLVLMCLWSAPGAADTEIALMEYSCRTEWNEVCNEQPQIKAPAGTRICSYTITEKTREGNADYRVVSATDTTVEIELNARGSLNPAKKAIGVIDLVITLEGVREGQACEDKPIPADPVNACTCVSAILERDVESCLSKGRARSDVACSDLGYETVCVSSQEECRHLMRSSCPNNASMDLVKTRKRIYVKDSPACAAKK